ncbi:MAG TPA: tagaturonate reductase [Flavobacteriaceae bacterium]|nr:tagaturonate reductase [Flavobacteriaceae bacterium]
MNNLNRKTANITTQYPIKVVQFGEGNFLRAFVDFIIDKLNSEADFNAGVAVVQPLNGGLIPVLNEQEGLYTLFMRGVKKGQIIDQSRVISCIEKSINPYSDYQDYLALAEEEALEFVISNTTESGIAYDPEDKDFTACPKSFPAKVTALLYKRFQYFNGEANKGLTIIPCELINYNAETLKGIILQYAKDWNLGEAFISWVENHNSFHNTLVDRIVPGYPKDDLEAYEAKLDYKDKLIVSAEIFLLWVIEGDDKLLAKIPFNKIDENVLVVKDMQPYRTRKVRILNGAHTGVVPFSILYGNKTVKETMDNAFTGAFLQQAVFDEINKTLPLPQAEVDDFAEEVFDRFRNPFIKHLLSSIALNSISKFKVRVLPSLLTYQENEGKLPTHLTFSLACLLRFYKGEWHGEVLPVQDDVQIVSFFKSLWSTSNTQEIVEKALSNKTFWDQDLTQVEGLVTAVVKALELIETVGIEEGFKQFSSAVAV